MGTLQCFELITGRGAQVWWQIQPQ